MLISDGASGEASGKLSLRRMEIEEMKGSERGATDEHAAQVTQPDDTDTSSNNEHRYGPEEEQAEKAHGNNQPAGIRRTRRRN